MQGDPEALARMVEMGLMYEGGRFTAAMLEIPGAGS